MYDDIADLYHLIYPDRDEAISAQGKALDRLIRRAVDQPRSVLDVSCGIGTQALALADLGYEVTASDLSTGAITRVRREAEAKDLNSSFSVADMRDCVSHHGTGFDVVLTADNSLPHLAAEDLIAAVSGFWECLQPGGAAVIGLRDYPSDEDRASPQAWPYGFPNHSEGRYYFFQTRNWDGESYDVAMYFVRVQAPDSPSKVIAPAATTSTTYKPTSTEPPTSMASPSR